MVARCTRILPVLQEEGTAKYPLWILSMAKATLVGKIISKYLLLFLVILYIHIILHFQRKGDKQPSHIKCWNAIEMGFPTPPHLPEDYCAHPRTFVRHRSCCNNIPPPFSSWSFFVREPPPLSIRRHKHRPQVPPK